jgi:hypothetical protein
LKRVPVLIEGLAWTPALGLTQGVRWREALASQLALASQPAFEPEPAFASPEVSPLTEAPASIRRAWAPHWQVPPRDLALMPRARSRGWVSASPWSPVRSQAALKSR